MSKIRVGKKIVGVLGIGALLATMMPAVAFAAIAIDGVGSVSIDVSENSTVVDDVPAGATIVGGDDRALFQITELDVLEFIAPKSFENPVDFGADNTYAVEVQDGLNSELVFVRVLNVNEAPEFSSSAEVDVDEGLTAVITVEAEDPDLGAGPTVYSIVAGVGDDDNALFEINEISGALTFIDAPDFELLDPVADDNEYLVRVAADSGLTSFQEITVTVTNTNDNGPVVTGGGAVAVNFTENGAGTVEDVDATDADSSVLEFTITGGADADLFAIDAETGELTFLAAPNFEDPIQAGLVDNDYVVEVSVSDEVAADTQTITVTVTDSEAEAPAIISNGGGATAYINVAEGATAVTTVEAVDEDALQTITYSITGGVDAALFLIDDETGELTLAAQDFEDPNQIGVIDNEYVVQVTATDSSAGLLTDTQTIAITVTDVNEFDPEFTSDATANFVENTSISTIALDVDATDADTSAELTYSIRAVSDDALSLDSASFEIDETTGELAFLASPNFEVQNTYVVVVRVSDGPKNVDQTITITVTNVNEAPTITSSRSLLAAENGTVVGVLTATDPDAGTTLTWSISGGEKTKFVINPATGRLSLTGFQDFENPIDADFDGVFSVQIRVSDGAMVDAGNFQVTITDLVEGPALDGEKGDAGDKGDAGERGVPGADGAPGTNGIDGTNGTNGTNGTDGAKGATGATGAAGTTGSQGPAGDVVLVFEYKLGSQSLSKLSVRKIKNLNEFKSAKSAKIVSYRKAGTSVKDSMVQARAMAAQIRLSHPTMKVTVSPSRKMVKKCKPVGNQCMSVVLSK